MTKKPIPLRVEDVAVFARSLARQLGDTSPSHLKLMNMVARAAGFQNIQHMRASVVVADRLKETSENTVADTRTAHRVLNQFDQFGRLRQWPSRRSVQTLALWALWANFPAKRALGERAVNDHFSGEHLFEDPATLRRSMISCGLLSRNIDGTNYRRVEQEPPADAKAVIRAVNTRRREGRAHSAG
ncbi:hypothetical protein RA28_21015 [Ruegeria sp. ANG-S4]|uniref:DUF2087 domain-containing protein n=1 Tax=Ruegeria sp. ANG-S4 TaxID=1577904 RepID=UPI00057DEF80|nr:DUF2087 domain-containing protein [Ruegeria sp. ANG-S4]KIC41023.1 hypothetical protein RA28_21015 [Ruegeria sp. ANG-S4]